MNRHFVWMNRLYTQHLIIKFKLICNCFIIKDVFFLIKIIALETVLFNSSLFNQHGNGKEW